jgi:hypothetical protein
MQEMTRNRIPRMMGALIVLIAALVLVMAGAAVVENASIGTRHWQFPAVGHTVNGYAGAPIGAQIYHPVTEITR